MRGEAPQESIGTVNLDLLRPSPTNPRKTFDEQSLEELANSIREYGLLQPIVCRPIGDGARIEGGKWVNLDHFEIVAGERRYRALKRLGSASARIIVRNLTDREALEVQVVENEQREGVSILERVAAYQNLISAGASVEEVAQKIGKSPSTIRGILRLNRLPAELVDHVTSGSIPQSTAELVCRVPGDQLRRRVAWCVLSGGDWAASDGGDLDFAGVGKRILSYRATKEIIQSNCMVELKSAPFSRKSINLIPGAGSCDACTKRAGNDPDATADGVRADVCMDPDCYQRKVRAVNEKTKRKDPAVPVEPERNPEESASPSPKTNTFENMVSRKAEHDLIRQAGVAGMQIFEEVSLGGADACEAFRTVVLAIASNLHPDRLGVLCSVRGVLGAGVTNRLENLRRHAAKLDDQDLAALATQCLIAEHGPPIPEVTSPLWEMISSAIGLDYKQIAAEARGKILKAFKAASPTHAKGQGNAEQIPLGNLAAEIITVEEEELLEASGLCTIGDLLKRAGSAKGPVAQSPYSILRGIVGLRPDVVNAIGDALVDANLIG